MSYVILLQYNMSCRDLERPVVPPSVAVAAGSKNGVVHWPAKGEPQKGNAQKATFKLLKSGLKGDLKLIFRGFHGWILFYGSPFPGQ